MSAVEAYEARLAAAAKAIRSHLPTGASPVVAIVCGTGLSTLSETISDPVIIPFDAIGFPSATVQGHSSQLVFGLLSGVPVLAQLGRFHA